jgi:WhiB family transcriptional regulator, redox-sensing transcriptional regulator
VLVRSVPLDGGAITAEPLGGDPADGGASMATLLTLPNARTGRDLPCRGGEADLWFAEAPADLERAKALCAPCPIRAECLAGALRREEPWGVWGGEIVERGVVIPRKRPRGRPSKADLARDRAYAAASA